MVESSKSAHLDIIGDSLRGRIPEIDNIFNDPSVAGALESILGENYVIHPHNFVHKSSLIDQGFHQDGNLPWNERGHYRSHRPDWALLFYYPQDVTIENGATELILGTQYWTKDFEKEDGTWYSQDSIDRSFGREDMSNEDLAYRDRRLSESVESLGVPDLERKYFVVPKGTVIICNYDILHRGSRSLPWGSRSIYVQVSFHENTRTEGAGVESSARFEYRECARGYSTDGKKYMELVCQQRRD